MRFALPALALYILGCASEPATAGPATNAGTGGSGAGGSATGLGGAGGSATGPGGAGGQTTDGGGAGGFGGGGGEPSVASVQLSASATRLSPNEPLTLTWQANADVCRFDGSSLPGALADWPSSGDACVGAAGCAAPHTVNLTPVVHGTYRFQLSCKKGGTPETTAQQAVEVDVEVPPGQCVAPAGLTRSLIGTISLPNGQATEDVDVTKWLEVFGIPRYDTTQSFPWPGAYGTDLKFYIVKNQYWSVEFKVGDSYPFYDPATNKPYGMWSSNDTLTTPSAGYTVSITENCGDFMPPADPNDPRSICYSEWWNTRTNGAPWAVAPEGTNVPGFCTLHRGKTYYFNMIAALPGKPEVSTCPEAVCKINLKHIGTFNGTQGM
ncbi:MAG: hypothetical protein OZ921_15660 [Sorangiineae bacterium]|nr:hypothetical protein [Polyangiaceae bacterium]MEB2323948.1 hypothetical protein [Sorangiineae bacterium]